MLLDDDTSNSNNETFGDFVNKIDILQKIQSDIRSEWHGDEPSINFFLLLAALLLLVIWIVFISFFFSRLLGLFVGIGFQRFLKWSGMDNVNHLSIGSFSISILSGKIMFRDILLVTEDYTIKVNDGWLLFSYWNYLPNNTSVQQCMSTSRLHLSINGLKVQVFNRLSVFQSIAKQTGMTLAFANLLNSFMAGTPAKEPLIGSTTTAKAVSQRNAEKLEMQLDAWWDKLWRLFGSIRVDVSSGRFIAGNHMLPTAFAVTFENMKCDKIYLTSASNPEDDRYMFRIEAKLENVKVSLVNSTDFASKGHVREEPPRTMGDGFAVLQSEKILFFYRQDLLGIVRDGVQSISDRIPIWESEWRFAGKTIFSYGPWADKQRAMIYSYFFPSDYGCTAVTEMPKKGQRRVLLKHEVTVSLLNGATIDMYFMRNEELNSIHSLVADGSSFEFHIPWIISENGFTSTIDGTFLKLESTTSLSFREFINCETMHFSVTSHYPRAFNHQQTWDFMFEFDQFSTYLVWDHKRFIVDLIHEWGSGDTPDLCTFVPCVWNFNLSIVDKFEFVLLLNDKNWVDTSSSSSTENVQAAIIGSRLNMSFPLVFTEFGTDTVPFELDMKAEDELAVKIKIPPENTLEPIFSALMKSAKQKLAMKPSSIDVKIAKDQTWVEIWRGETIDVKCEYEYHSVHAVKLQSDIPTEFSQKWLPAPMTKPSQLEPDNLFFQVDIGNSEAQVTGLLLKLILELKDNYFGVYDQMSDISKKPLHSANLSSAHDCLKNVEDYRPMNAFFKLRLENLQGHCIGHQFLHTDESKREYDYCPVINIEEILVELKKEHTEALVQVMVGPSMLNFSSQNSHCSPSSDDLMAGQCSLSTLQFRGHGLYSDIDVPWEVECMEYAWLVEVLIGEINGKISPQELVKVIQILDSFLVLTIAADESTEVPERFNLCHHFQNLCFCPFSDLKLIDNKNRWQKCVSSEALKYRLFRLSIDALKLFIVDERHSAISIETDNVRVSFCNAHLGSFAENVILELPASEIGLYMNMNDHHWLKCGGLPLKQTCFDIRLPYKQSEAYLPEEREKFLRKHDAQHKWLYFLSPHTSNKNSAVCSCFGGCRFFARNDTIGSTFHSNDHEPLARPTVHRDLDDQPGFFQSILAPQTCGIKIYDNRADSLASLTESIRFCSTDNQEQDPSWFERKMSDGSFHSAASHRPFSVKDAECSPQTSAYIGFLDVYEIDRADTNQPLSKAKQVHFAIRKALPGVTGLKLTRKEDPKNQCSQMEYTPRRMILNSSDELPKDTAGLYIRATLADKIEAIVSPLCTEVVERFTNLAGQVLARSHPAFLVQRTYQKCAAVHHVQPLTASIVFRRREEKFSPSMVRVSIALPEVNIASVQCEVNKLIANSSSTRAHDDINSMAMLRMPESSFEISSVTNPNEERKLIVTLHSERNNGTNRTSDLGQAHFQIIQLVDEKVYEDVYNRLPVTATNNWAQIIASIPESPLEKVRPKVVMDVQIPKILSTLHIPTNFASRRINCDKNHKSNGRKSGAIQLDIRIDVVNVTTILGSIDNQISKQPAIVEEKSLFEVMNALVNLWLVAGHKCSEQISKTRQIVADWNDLSFTKLLADALDWQDDQILKCDKTAKMRDVKLYSRHMHSCPSCKLMLDLLHYIGQNEEKIAKQYLVAISQGSDQLLNKEKRKKAIIALLSHWQTVICTEVLPADNIIAAKFKYNTTRSTSQLYSTAEHNTAKNSKFSEEPTQFKNVENTYKALKPDKNITNESKSTLDNKYVSDDLMALPSKIAPQNGRERSCTPPPESNVSTSTSATPFRPTHRRGPSNVTQATLNEEPQDLYHRILKAHKEYKEQKEHTAAQNEPTPAEVNPMELILDVFFWTIFEAFELDGSPLDSLPQKNVSLSSNLQLSELTLNVIEKKFLLSQRKETLVALSSHHLITIENVDLSGNGSLSLRMDEHMLRPSWANIKFEYATKIQNVRMVVSLPSVFFLNDLTQFIRGVLAMVANLSTSTTVMTRKRTLIQETKQNLSEWSIGVLDKLYDYERSFPPRRHSTLNINIVGNWALKMATFESMITDLFISMTILKINLKQEHNRVHSSPNMDMAQCRLSLAELVQKRVRSDTIATPNDIEQSEGVRNKQLKSSTQSLQQSASAIQPVENAVKDIAENINEPLKFPPALILDSLEISLKRANLIVSEHIAPQKAKNPTSSETRQILNCSLRETHAIYERLLDEQLPDSNENSKNAGSSPSIRMKLAERIRNKLNLSLGELDGDLPMHAESIHEVVLRHGPQLNEQLHRIVGQPQPSTVIQPLSTPDELSRPRKFTNEFGMKEKFELFRQPSPSTPSTEYVSPNGELEDFMNLVENDESLPQNIGEDLMEPVLATALPFKRPEIEFEIKLAGVELNVQLLPSLKAKYKLERALSSGKSGQLSEFSAEIADHRLYFLVTNPSTSASNLGTGGISISETGPSMQLDTFTLQLPRICASGTYRQPSNQFIESKTDGWNCNELIYRKEGYYHITIIIGSMNHTFSTDLLNQILFAEQSFRSELSFLLDRLSSERPKTESGGAALMNVNPILFSLELKGEGVPWLQVTASTPTSTAIRFTVDNPHGLLTNRLISATNAERTTAKIETTPAKVQLNGKLGQLYKSALYEETHEEFEEYANFMTQISVQNEEAITKDSLHSYLITLNRPFLLIKSNAVDKAILLWLNYRNTYNYWREERSKLLVNRYYDKKKRDIKETTEAKLTREAKLKPQEQQKSSLLSSRDKSPSTAPSNFATDMNINLSLSIQNGLYVCMPLYSAELNDNMAALVLSLQKSDVTVCVRKELACNASFNAFKVTFIENFDEQSLSEPWLHENTGDGGDSRSNFFFFPSGSYKFCTSATSPTAHNQNAKWILSVKSHMQGMVIDFDYKIGKLTSLLIHTLSQFASDDEDSNHLEFGQSGEPTQDVLPGLAENDEFNKVVGHENKIRWLERKMHEQSVLVTDLMNLGASEFAIEKERRKLRILELARFKQFRQSVWEKIREKVHRNRNNTDESNNTVNYAALADDVDSTSKHPDSGRQHSRTLLSANSSSTATTATSSQLVSNLTVDSILPGGKPAVQTIASESVDMNIDIQISIECGQCILRANQTSASQRGFLTKKPSARDLKSKLGGMLNSGGSLQSVTKLSIPSLDARMFYTSNDPVATVPAHIRQLFQGRERVRATPPNVVGLKNKCFYMALELASMPLETQITPCLADFLEQVVEPLPESLFEPAIKTDNETESNANSLPIVAMDTSSLPLDVLFHMSVQSSTIRFEGQQQRSSAADCLLTLPSLTLMASTRKYSEQELTVAGLYLSATLSNFSLSIYSPHQQSSSHDALSLTLDRFSVTASRTKNPSNSDEDRNKVQLVIVSNVGAANFNYDMRRLSELLTFPKPWYRKQLIRRLFFGDQSVAATNAAANLQRFNSSSTSAYQSPHNRHSSKAGSISGHQITQKGRNIGSAHQINPTSWAASVIFSMQWRELNVNAQMSNTMGNTQWLARQGILRGHVQLDSRRNRDVALSFKLLSSELTAQGGAISGEVAISKLLISARHTKNVQSAPENVASLRFEKLECRSEWMSRPIFIGRFANPMIIIRDEWKSQSTDGEVYESHFFVNITGSWSDLQMIITKTTVGDMIKIGEKLITFFKDQLKNSRMVWGPEFDQNRLSTSSEDTSSTNTLEPEPKQKRATFDHRTIYTLNGDEISAHSVETNEEGDETDASDLPSFLQQWHRILDSLTEVQIHKKFLPLPRSMDGITFVGGNIELNAKRISLACMNGEMNAASWAFFHMSDVGVCLTSRSHYAFMDEKNTSLGVHTKQQFVFRLGDQSRPAVPEKTALPDFKAVVCRVQHNRGFLLRHHTSIELSLEAIINDVLKQLNLLESHDQIDAGKVQETSSVASMATPKAPPPRFTHNVLQLFQFPSLEAVLTSLQNHELDRPKIKKAQQKKEEQEATQHTVDRPEPLTVQSSFTCDFRNTVGVQTDFNAQVSFLPELLKSYIVTPHDLTEAILSNTLSTSEKRSTPRRPITAVQSSASMSTPSGVSSIHQAASGGAIATSEQIYKEYGLPSTSANKDPRQYVCLEWIVDPKIQFIDRFKWNPPVIDDILKKLQIFDHRRTIPKVMQRGVLDRGDMLLAAILEQILNQVKRE
ncbi:hypothetical protein DdX_00092 [Ditylenchus destructor]|uniref:Bridge-like lipid transfer protein family member 1 C-terminal domain-containing protein n=1 Tax=Ditylenchus destructor TaxID=166010 RepID=A0AAD4NI25_9BILA|nr:hypothetical protein DdX_00092 [Ditylenchus destructor]